MSRTKRRHNDGMAISDMADILFLDSQRFCKIGGSKRDRVFTDLVVISIYSTHKLRLQMMEF